jgi:hypothetical protein
MEPAFQMGTASDWIGAARTGRLRRVLTHRQILREVWGQAHESDTYYPRVYKGPRLWMASLAPGAPGGTITEITPAADGTTIRFGRSPDLGADGSTA